MDSTAIAELVRTTPGFVRTLGPTIERSSRHEAVLRLDAGPHLHNHIGGPHAAAIFGLGETAAFVLLLQVFGDLVEQGAVPLVKSAEIDYTAVATGPVVAAARLAGAAPRSEADARSSYAERDVAVFGVTVQIAREGDGVQTATMNPLMALKRF